MNTTELSRRLSVSLIRAANLEAEMSKLAPVSDSELRLMYALADGKPHSQMQIADGLGISRTTLNGIVKRWEKNGFLTLNKIVGKRREKEICLTPAGIQKIKSTLALSQGIENGALALTVNKYSESFVEALEFYAQALSEEYEARQVSKKAKRSFFRIRRTVKES